MVEDILMVLNYMYDCIEWCKLFKKVLMVQNVCIGLIVLKVQKSSEP